MQADPMGGIVSMLLGIASFATMDALGKWVVQDYSVFQVLAVRTVFAVAILLAAAPRFGGRESIRTKQPAAHVMRALCSALSFLFFFAAVRVLPLADAIAVEFGGPFIVMALAVPILGERADRGRWLAVAAGFLGMLLVVQPTRDGIRPEALLALSASFSYSLMMVLTRWMSMRSGASERTFVFLVYATAVQGIVGGAGSLFGWKSMSVADLAVIAGMGVFTLGGQLGVTIAFQRAPAAVVVPFEYTALLWATLYGFAIFGDFPAPSVWLGAAVIVGAGLYTLRRAKTAA